MEEVDELVERELVHVVQFDEIRENEEESAAELSERVVDASLCSQFALQLLALRQRLLDHTARLLRLLERAHQLLVLQQITFAELQVKISTFIFLQRKEKRQI